LREKGLIIFEKHCLSCHEVIPHDKEGDHYKSKKTSLIEVGTDPMMAWSISNHKAKTLILEHSKADIVIGDHFGPTTRALDIPLNGVGLVLKNPTKALEAGIISAEVKIVKMQSWKDHLKDHADALDTLLVEQVVTSMSNSLDSSGKNLAGLVYNPTT
jgi:hypothetical protein